MSDQIDKMLSGGRENQKFIALGKAWCTHIRTDRSLLGVGMVEQMTGLPITGGKFTCDFARNPGNIVGMMISGTALDFYENNCLGCQNRSPGGRVPNLSTWAEPLLADRHRREIAESQEQQVAAKKCQQRIEHRRLASISFNSTSQEIVELINRLDLDISDTEAEQQLKETATLLPDALIEIKDILYEAVADLKSSVLLEVSIAIEGDLNSEKLRSLCVAAVSEGWGSSEVCSYLSKNGVADDLTEDFLYEMILCSVPSERHYDTQSTDNSAVLRHYHSLDHELVESKIIDMLQHGDNWRRNIAAKAVYTVIKYDKDSGRRLLTPLLNGLKFPESYSDDAMPSWQIAQAVGMVFLNSPTAVRDIIQKRWRKSTPTYKSRIIGCFEPIIDTPLGKLSSETVQICLDQIFTALSEPLTSEPLTSQQDSITEDYQIRAAQLLKELIVACPSKEISPETLIYTLLQWADKKKTLDESKLGNVIAIEAMNIEARIGAIIRDISDSIIATSSRNPNKFLTICFEIHDGVGHTPDIQAIVVRIIGRITAKSLNYLSMALPRIYTAMLGEDQIIRAAGMRATAKIIEALPSESVPPLLAQAVIAGLTDNYLIVVLEAIETSRQIPADLVDCKIVSTRLLAFSRAYAVDRGYLESVQSAIITAIRLAKDDDILLPAVQKEALYAINLMPAHSARETIWRVGSVRQEQLWIDVAIKALRADEDYRYEQLGDRDKRLLLRELGSRILSESQAESLAANEIIVSRYNYDRAILSADLLAELNRPDLSVQIIESALNEIPNTLEQRSFRATVNLTLLCFKLEAAIAAGDQEWQSDIYQELTSSTNLLEPTRRRRVDPHYDMVESLKAKVEIIGALTAGSDSTSSFREALDAYKSTVKNYVEGDVVWAYLEILESLVHAFRWVDACRNAEVERDRYVEAARLRAREVIKQSQDTWPVDLVSITKQLVELEDYDAPFHVASKLRCVPIPPRVTDLFKMPDLSKEHIDRKGDQSLAPAVALMIRFHGEPVMRPTIIQPGAMHQFEVEVRVNQWPSDDSTLKVIFAHVYGDDFLYASELSFTPNILSQNLEIRVAGERPPDDPPLSLTALARFQTGDDSQTTRIIGNTTLELTTFDSDTALPLGMPAAARRIKEMMSEVTNTLPHISTNDGRDVRLLLGALARFSHTVIDDRLDAQIEINEPWFEKELKFFLTADPNISARLNNQVGRAGGSTDLLLGNIVLELKVEKKKPISLDDAINRFVRQPTQYASAQDSQISLLAVWDASPKRAPAGVMGNEMKWAYPETTSGSSPPFPSMVGVVIIRAGFPRPSDFSQY